MDSEGRSSDKKKRHSPRMPERRYGYFRDDQIIFLVTHPTDALSDNLLERFRIEIDTQLGTDNGTVDSFSKKISFPVVFNEQRERRLAELEELERVAELKRRKLLSEDESNLLGDLPRPFQGAFSLLVCTLKDLPKNQEPITLLDNITQLRLALGKKEISLDPTKLPTGDVETEMLTVEDVSPNWLMSVASNGSGTGGPGGPPTVFKGDDSEAKYKFTEFINKLVDEGLYGNGDKVDVAILDTAPSSHAYARAPKEHPNNLLLQTLKGKLTLYPATPEENDELANTSLNRHDYKMTDHGLFAAGIVHSIAPEAKIHLFEVLNQWGVGDLATLAAGVKKVYEQLNKPGSDRKLVVNCSWMLDFPSSDDHCKAKKGTKPEEEDPEYDFEQGVLEFVKADREHAKALWATCNDLFAAGAQVVAAAGNDWDWAIVRKQWNRGPRAGGTNDQADDARPDAPEARYPAGFVSVIGVGALPKHAKPDRNGKYKASKYSNLGDKPAGDAIVTLGGEEGQEKGVLGLYISEAFPVEKNSNSNPSNYYKREFDMVVRDKNKNEDNGWAWWAGTSFATPILTGAIAAVLSNTTNPAADTQQAVARLREKGFILQALTDAEEDVMLVKQDDEIP